MNMLKGGVPIGRVFGIALRLHYSWFLVFALVTWALAFGYFPSIHPRWALSTSLAAGIVTSLLFFGSVLAHELAHSVIAQSEGIPVKSITLFIFGGVSQITREPQAPRDEFRMALAGPVCSLIIGGLFWALWYYSRPFSTFIPSISFWLAWINIFLGLFNLIPGFPLDGGRVLRALLWWRNNNLRRATHTASNIGRGVGYLFIFGGIFLIFLGNWFNGLWLAFIGWFLENAAVGSYRQVALQEGLRGHTVSEIMTRDCLTVSADLSLEQLVNEHILKTGRRCFPVVREGRVEGLVSLHDVRALPREAWPSKRVSETMIPLDKMKWVTPDQDLAVVMDLMTEQDINQVPVVQDNNVVGMIARDNLLSFIRTRSELGM